MIMVGDDYQLPPPSNTHLGPFDIPNTAKRNRQISMSVRANGISQYMNISKRVMSLKTVRRQQKSQTVFADILSRLRTGTPTADDANTLMKLRLDRFTCTEQKEIESGDTIHLFANKVPRDEHNIEKLAGLVKDNNPLAVIKGVLKPIKGKK